MAPSNRPARAFCAPRASEPQTGWPPTKRWRSAAGTARTTCPFVEPMSVTVAPGGAAASAAAIAAGTARPARTRRRGRRPRRPRRGVRRLLDAAALERRGPRGGIGIEPDRRRATALAQGEAERATHQPESDDRRAHRGHHASLATTKRRGARSRQRAFRASRISRNSAISSGVSAGATSSPRLRRATIALIGTVVVGSEVVPQVLQIGGARPERVVRNFLAVLRAPCRPLGDVELVEDVEGLQHTLPSRLDGEGTLRERHRPDEPGGRGEIARKAEHPAALAEPLDLLPAEVDLRHVAHGHVDVIAQVGHVPIEGR